MKSKILYAISFILLILSSLPCFAAPSTSLVINEVMFNPAGSQTANEWVEFIAKNDVTITNPWTFRTSTRTYTVPVGTTLNMKAGEILVLYMTNGVNVTRSNGFCGHIFSDTYESILLHFFINY